MGVSLDKPAKRPPTSSGATHPHPNHRWPPFPWSPTHFLLIAGLAVFLGVFILWQHHEQQAQKSLSIQASVWASLKDFKTDPKSNQKLDGDLLRLAKKAVDLDSSNESRGLLALVSVWQHKWHLRGAKWRPIAFDEDEETTAYAMQGDGGNPTALLARAWLLSNACVLMPLSHTKREAVCEDAKLLYPASANALKGNN